VLEKLALRAIVASIVLIWVPSAAWAQALVEQQYYVFRLSSEATVDVNNDMMVAILVVQDEDKDPGLLADKINSASTWATNVLRPFATVNFKTRDYQTQPRYDTSQSRRLIGWRASQTIELETGDFEAAGKAIQKLQEKLQVQSIRLSAKQETQAEASDLLIAKALNLFKDRARLVQKNMGAAGFKVMDVDIQTRQHRDDMFAHRASDAELSLSAVQSEPAIEAGTTRVSVQVSGRIQIQ
jgi:predicted secreted protein